ISIIVFPNPFNSAVSISAPAGAEIAIYDLRGNVVYAPSIPRSLSPQGERDDALVGAGSEGQSPSPSREGFRMRGSFIWQPDESIPSGIYLVRATIPQQNKSVVCTKRIVYLK
ncbi:hypothetical protein J7M00_08625, partial [bacterium]|nr:hypothetical protein [bacterium]